MLHLGKQATERLRKSSFQKLHAWTWVTRQVKYRYSCMSWIIVVGGGGESTNPHIRCAPVFFHITFFGEKTECGKQAYTVNGIEWERESEWVSECKCVCISMCVHWQKFQHLLQYKYIDFIIFMECTWLILGKSSSPSQCVMQHLMGDSKLQPHSSCSLYTL
jgi:hypothetical protein